MFRSVAASCLLMWLCAAPAAAQHWATRMFKSTSHDFGTVARGSKAEHEFVFENLYKEVVHVASVRSSCGCTTTVITKSTLKTFEKSSIVAKFNTRSFLGQKGATLTVVIDKPFYAEVQLTVRGYIRSDVVFEPGEVNFGEVDQFSAAEQTIRVSYAGRPNWRIVDVRSANPHFAVELTETERNGGRVSYQMVVQLKPDAPAGYVEDQLTIVTDENRGQVPIEVHGSVKSPLTVSPAALLLGALHPGDIVKKQLVVGSKTPFKILNVKCDGNGFEFKPSADEKKTLHYVPVTYTAGDQLGTVEQKIEIETDIGEGARATCIATATISKAEPEKKPAQNAAPSNGE